ncbi:hypothetical protein GCM10009743_08270 [Kribbella swartbergensis]
MGNALTSLWGLGETNGREELRIEETTVTGKWNAMRAWREAIALSACLRPVREDRSGSEEVFYHQLGTELSPRYGGPPV